ncbi:GlsB/YeaQ/YmgE family stress response membrane protein [Methylocaldum sp. MU1018]
MLLWIIFGGVAGWVASMIVGREDQIGILGNIAVGIIGAFIGGWIADRLGFGGKPGVERPTSLVSFATAVLGAVIFLAILNALF